MRAQSESVLQYPFETVTCECRQGSPANASGESRRQILSAIYESSKTASLIAFHFCCIIIIALLQRYAKLNVKFVRCPNQPGVSLGKKTYYPPHTRVITAAL